jgi:hypothetical protein
VDEGCKIPTVIENEVEGLTVLEGGKLLLQTPFVLLFGLALPCEAILMSAKIS